MSALTQDRKTDQVDPNSVIPQLLSFPAEASTKIYGGAMVATNAAGNAVPASASTALKLWGRCERQTDNSSGGAGALQVPVRPGCFYYASGTSADAIAAANVGQACYSIDDNTVGLTDGAGTRPYAGVIVGVRSDGQVAVLVGQPGAYAPVGQQGAVQHVQIDIPLATIIAQTSGTAFNIGAALPANARLLAAEVDVVATVTGGTLSAVTSTIQNTGETAGAIQASHSVFAATGFFNTAGSNPYASRGTQQLQMTLTATGDTLAHATTGHLQVNLFYVEVA